MPVEEANEFKNPTMEHIILNNNLIVSNTLLHFACLDYIENYKTNLVPFNYIEYYIKLVGTYDKFFKEDLNNFYNNLDYNNLDIELLAQIYSRDSMSIVVSVVSKDSIEFIVTDENPIDLLTYYMESEQRDTNQKKIYENTKKIVVEIGKSDELITKKGLYEKYMIDKFLESYFTNNINNETNKTKSSTLQKTEHDTKQDKTVEKQTTKAKETIEEKQKQIEDHDLKGKEIEVPEQKGKVVKLFIPKLLLPSPYPVLQDTSRINSDFKVRDIKKADAMITIFNKYKFKAVIYSTGFIGKRKKIKKPKPKFSFDF